MPCYVIEHDLYPVLANFIVYKPVLDLQEVPMFYLLVHSSSNQVRIVQRLNCDVYINLLAQVGETVDHVLVERRIT